jgi:hypothetical protein
MEEVVSDVPNSYWRRLLDIYGSEDPTGTPAALAA